MVAIAGKANGARLAIAIYLQRCGLSVLCVLVVTGLRARSRRLGGEGCGHGGRVIKYINPSPHVRNFELFFISSL